MNVKEAISPKERFDSSKALALLERAAAEGKLSATAVAHIRTWLTQAQYAEYAPILADHIQKGLWSELDEVFWQVIPFGTGGRRGRMYPIGTNAINDRTIAESAQGVADYVREQLPDQMHTCAIAYDTRHRSREFARLCAEVMVANGFHVYFLQDHRSTPELSFTVRYKKCSCGLMITASHNPPQDNAIKVYWSTGGQLLPPHDEAVIRRVMQVRAIRRANFDEALAAGKILFCQEEVDAAFQRAVLQQSRPGPRNLKILYSPLHGVGTSAVVPVLQADGFTQVEVFGPHSTPDGNFPNVPKNQANPENPQVFDALIQYAQAHPFDLILATDPDCDRVGCAAPIRWEPRAAWGTLTGNQIGALLTEFCLEQARSAGTLTPAHYVVKTAVTTELIRRIAESYGVRCVGDLLVGFKWIGGMIDELGPERFLLGAEESYGFLVGTHVRDKDAAVASMLLSELAAQTKAAGQTLHQRLDNLFMRYGCHQEAAFSRIMPGAEGMQASQALMARFRSQPPEKLAGMPVVAIRDFLQTTRTEPGGITHPYAVAHKGDMLFFDLVDPEDPETTGAVAVRPSGTEPKIKFYLFAYQPPEKIKDLESAKKMLQNRLAAMEANLQAYLSIS